MFSADCALDHLLKMPRMSRQESEKRTIDRAIAYLDKAVERCQKEPIDHWSLEPPLQFLQMRAKDKSPFEQFRQALQCRDTEMRCQTLNVCLNAIKLAFR